MRFDDDSEYTTFDSWLPMSVARVLWTLGGCAAVEVLSSVFATARPWDALTHGMVLDTVQALAGEPRNYRGWTLFAPAVPTTTDRKTIAKGADDGRGRRRARG